MTTAIKRRRGTTAEHSTFVGLEGELTVDVTKDTVVVHDGSTTGGFPLLREDLSNNANVLTTTNTKTLSNKTLDLASNTVTGTLAQFNAALSDSNFVDTTSTQTIGGVKTFSSTISGSIDGNAATVTNGVYTTGAQTIADVKTFSSNPVLSAGTANGVLYLNGSKVATSGSALTFDGTNTLKLKNTLTFDRYGDNTEGLTVSTNSGNGVYNTFGGLNHVWQLASSEGMRLTSTGLGIGTSSPTAQLQLNKSGTGDYTTFRLSNSGASGKTFEIGVGGNTAAAGYANSLYFYDSTAGALRMTLDTSGNLGLGVTPSAWSGVAPAIQIAGGGAFIAGRSTNAEIYLGTNAHFNGSNWVYKTSNPASYYAQDGSEHKWYRAASGTAGNAITFTQAMTLDASGRLSVGTTSTTKMLEVQGSVGYLATFRNNSSTATTSYINVINANNVNAGMVMAHLSDGTGYFGTQNNAALLFVTNDTERARIDSSGILFSVPTYNNATGNAANMFVGSDGSFNRSTSSLKYKRDVQDAVHGLSDVLQLRPVTYKGKSPSDGEKVFGGLIAEEVHDAGLTEFVQYAEDGTPDALAYGNMVSLCIKAIQEQQAIIESLKARLDAANL